MKNIFNIKKADTVMNREIWVFKNKNHIKFNNNLLGDAKKGHFGFWEFEFYI